MRNGRLRDIEGGREIADAHWLLRVAQAERDLKAGRVGECFEDFARLFDLLGARLQRGRAAYAALALRQHHELFHGMSLADPLTNVNGFASVASTLVYASEVRCGRHPRSRSRALRRQGVTDGRELQLLRYELLRHGGHRLWRGIHRAGARIGRHRSDGQSRLWESDAPRRSAAGRARSRPG